MSAALSTSIVPKNAITVAPPDLDRAVQSLTDDIQQAVAGLYKLETATINGLAQSSFSDTLLDEFTMARRHLQVQWLKFRDLLRDCSIYSEVYRIYRERPELSRNLLQKAQKLSGNAKDAKNSYDVLCEQLQKQRAKLSSLLHSSDNGKNQTRSTFLDETAKQSDSSTTTPPTIFQAALEWSNPDGPASIAESYTALEQISISIGDIAVFWQHHVHELDSAGDEVRSSVATWSGSKTILDDAVCTIHASADAVIVNAVGMPSIKNGPNLLRLLPRLLQDFFHSLFSKF